MTQRVLTASVGFPITIILIWVGLPWLTIATILVALLGLTEFYRIATLIGAKTFLPLGLIWTTLFCLAVEISELHNILIFWYWLPIFFSGILVASVWLIRHRKNIDFAKSIIFMLMGPLFLGFLFSHGLMLREIGDSESIGRNWLFLAILVTFATDTGAFLVGKTIGHHAMAPTISPGKTWEGAFGGLFCAAISAIGLGLLFDLSPSPWHFLLIGISVGSVAQLGDLAESRLKRLARLKNSGDLLPGHGGFLDRLDSMIFTLPLVYYLAVLIK